MALGVLTRLVKSFGGGSSESGAGAAAQSKVFSDNGTVRTKEEIDAAFPDRQPDPQSKVSPAEADAWVTSNFQKIKTSLMTYHQQVWQAILFYVGNTWINWDISRNFWVPQAPVDDFTPQPRINYYAPPIDAIASNFNSIPPVESIARDADGDEEYKRHGISVVANRLAKDFILRTGLKSDFQSKGDKPSVAAYKFVLCGTLFTYVQTRSSTPIASPDLGEIAQVTVECDLCDSLEGMPRPGSFELGGLAGTPYFYLARRMTLQEIYTRFQVNVPPDQQFITGNNTIYQASLDYFYTGANNDALKAEDSALILEVFIPPSSDTNPGVREFAETGLYAVYAGEHVRYCEDWKFPDHPITKIDYIRVPRLFFARTPAFDMCPIQEEIQGYESLIKLHGMTNAVSPWVVDANTLVGEITGRADKVIKYRSIGPNSPPPKREAPGSLDQGIYAQVEKLKGQLEAISGAASVFRGRQEGSVTSGVAISQLRGQAEQMFARPVINWNNGWKETVRKAVLFMQKSYTLAQIMAIVGSGMDDAITDFRSCDLDECLEWLASGHSLPATQDEQRQEMMELFDRKAIDPKDPNVREKLFNLFGETGMLKMFNLDATRARMENKFMKLGKPPIFRPAIEDLDVHYALHTEAVKSLEFDRLSPQVQEIFLAHVMETKTAMAPPPPPPAPPPSVAITADMAELPPALTDAILEAHGIHPAPAIGPPPPHHVGKPVTDPNAPPPPPHGPGPGTQVTKPKGDVTRAGVNTHSPSNLPSQGRPSTTTLPITGQGVQPIGAAKGAPPGPGK